MPCDVRLQYGLTAAYEIGDTPWISGYDTGSTFGVLLSGLGQGQTYHFRAQARNDAGTASGADDVFTCAPHSIGWVSPSSSSDPTGNWLGTDLAHDDESTTHAHCVHLINDPDGQWSPYLYLTHSLVNVDSLRFLAKDDVNIDSAEIDLSPDGTSWNNVFGSAFLDQTWTAVGFPDQNANQARVRFHLSTNAVGMHWELGELDFHVSRILSVTVSNAVFGFGTQLLDTWLSPDSTVVTNDSAEIENLDVRLSQFQSGADSWTISPVTNGANQVRAQWSAVSSSGPWTDIAAYDTDFTIGTNVAPSSSITLFVRIQTPTSTDSHEEYSSSLTVTAW
ncbi:MAG: hypothetical protein R3E12_18665 [Candidatus Eisenbacteria bacterium]